MQRSSILRSAFLLAATSTGLHAQSFESVSIEFGDEDPKFVVAADLDGDGDDDVLEASDAGGTVTWSENLGGDARRWETHTIASGLGAPHNVAAADLDGDGDLDVAAVTKVDGSVLWFENLAGSGTSWAVHSLRSGLGTPKYLDAADLDGDGDLDLAVAASTDDDVLWYENEDGAFGSTTEHVASDLLARPACVLAADVDADGDLDLVSSSSVDETIAWLENDGTGCFTGLRVVTTDSYAARRLRVADVDGDGDLDVLSTSATASTLRWHANLDGVGGVWSDASISLQVRKVKALHVGDLDSDGDLDVVTASVDDDKIAWFENVGAGTAWIQHVIATDFAEPSAVHVADMDADGDLDVVFSAIGEDQVGCLLSGKALGARAGRFSSGD